MGMSIRNKCFLLLSLDGHLFINTFTGGLFSFYRKEVFENKMN
jgi:hypothetical protein